MPTSKNLVTAVTNQATDTKDESVAQGRGRPGTPDRTPFPVRVASGRAGRPLETPSVHELRQSPSGHGLIGSYRQVLVLPIIRVEQAHPEVLSP